MRLIRFDLKLTVRGERFDGPILAISPDHSTSAGTVAMGGPWPGRVHNKRPDPAVFRRHPQPHPLWVKTAIGWSGAQHDVQPWMAEGVWMASWMKEITKFVLNRRYVTRDKADFRFSVSTGPTTTDSPPFPRVIAAPRPTTPNLG
jgi:hypothetical protein